MSSDKLAHSLMMRFGLAPEEPTPEQIGLICDYIENIEKIRTPSEYDWRRAVETYCPTYKTYKRASVDDTDLNRLIEEMRSKGK